MFAIALGIITGLLAILLIQQRKQYIKLMATITNVQTAVDELTQDVADETTVVDSAIVFINGVPALIAAAVAAAQSAGATPEQLQAFTDLTTTMKAKSAALQAALTTNVPTPATAPGA